MMLTVAVRDHVCPSAAPNLVQSNVLVDGVLELPEELCYSSSTSGIV